MSRHQSALVNVSQYVVARMAASMMGVIDTRTVLRTAGDLAKVLHRLDKRHRKRAEMNIASCFPDWDQSRIEEVAEESMRFLFQLAVEILQAPRFINIHTWQDRIRFVGVQPALQRIVERKPLILLTGHCGNWEIWGWVLSTLGVQLHALARPLDNPLIWRWFAGIRQKQGLRLVTKWGATDEMVRIIDSGGIIGVIADQNAGDQGLFVPFFNRLASSYKSIALLALKYDVPVACGHAVRIGDDLRYELRLDDYIQPVDWYEVEDPVFYITARYNKAMETMIRSEPGRYLWMHRRWKSRPRFERLNRGVPGSLKRKLASLPWMDEETLQRIIADSEKGFREG